MRTKLLLVLLFVLLLCTDEGDAWGRRRRRRRRRWSWLSRRRSCSVGNTGSNQYDADLAAKLMRYSAVAYLKANIVNQWSCSACKNMLQHYKHTGNAYSSHHHSLANVGYDSHPSVRSVIVAFRGSSIDEGNFANWFRVNLKFTKVRASSIASSAGSVHRGFYYAYLAMRDALKQQIIKAMPPGGPKKVIFTGHSLGGALATLAATDPQLRSVTGSDVRIYTFGSPRVGDKCFASFFTRTVGHSRSYRVYHSWDVVTKMPPTTLFGYHHVPIGVNDKSQTFSHKTYLHVTLSHVKGRKRREVIMTDHQPEVSRRNMYAM